MKNLRRETVAFPEYTILCTKKMTIINITRYYDDIIFVSHNITIIKVIITYYINGLINNTKDIIVSNEKINKCKT